MTRFDTPNAARIFKEMYKRAKYLHNDKSAALITNDGLNLKMIQYNVDSSVGNQFSKNFGNTINKWAEMLETVSYGNTITEKNLTRQLLYLKIIGLMCKDEQGKGIYHYQLQALVSVISNE